ncbi:U3 small nucleolar RNA-associated protein 8 [Candida viswanathii]|uniref:U3 small nucleolar RNA-associated protein 8 n=1 Tax=Candida viswanathii TaxID=5486 RepID=A0A367XQN2_9ASCO|nr:U3 small nucleolar RNA-associated protein 8 [Candida viswanathii]
MSKPDLYDQYVITSLPRTPDLTLSEKVIVPRITSIDASIIDLGISKSIIASHITRPTPKLIWSYALNPTTLVDCMDVTTKDDVKYYVCGLTDRKKSKLLLLETKSSVTEDGTTNYATANEVELKVNSRPVGIKFMGGPDLMVVVYENGSVEQVKFVDSQMSLGDNKFTNSKSKEKVVFNAFIQDLEDELLLTVSRDAKNTIYRLIAINPVKSIIQITSSSVPLIKDAQYCYISGTLYQYSNKHIDSLLVANFATINTICVASIIDNEEQIVSITTPAPDRLLLGNSSKLYLVNFKFASLLSTFQSSSSSAHPVPDIVYINQVVQVKGNSANSSVSMAVYLNLKNKNNNVYLNVIDINVGLNKLSECLGKALEKGTTEFHQIPELFTTEGQASGDANEVKEVYELLKQAQEAKDLNKWESVLIPYLKNKKSWSSIKSSISKKPKRADKVYEFKEFEDNTDRVVDIKFIDSVLNLIFTSDPPEFVDEGFVPEYTLMYLLTNPLFPLKFTSGLVQLFNDTGNTTLLRQAVNTCPGIPCRDLVVQLVYDSDNDTLTDLVNRIVGEFSPKDITAAFKEVLQSEADLADVIELITKMLKLSELNAWYIIEILIDVNGLLNWDMIDVDALNEIVTQKIDALTVNSYNLTLSNQVLLHSEKKPSKKSKEPSQLDNILTLVNKDDSKRGTSEADSQQKVPIYSVEKLEV